MTNASGRLRSLYICYLSLDDPLTHTQVVAYLAGLASAGHQIHLLTFETEPLTRAHRARRRLEMAAHGIVWHGLRYHKRPSLPATAYDTFAGAFYACWLKLRFGIDVFHARNHVPAAMAMLVQRLLGRWAPALIFDVRGLMAEEYVDAGRWEPGGTPFRLIKAVERAAIARAAGIVVLTQRVRAQLFGESTDAGVFVIPCCAELSGEPAAGARPDGAPPVMAYIGKLEGWYMAAEMAEFFAVARRSIPDLHFLILTQGAPEPIRDRLELVVPADSYTITSAPAAAVAGHLAAASFGISFIRPLPSKASSSPTKVGEYLAAGLPVLATSGVGDLDLLLTPSVGVLVHEHTHAAYAQAAEEMIALISDPAAAERCRVLARTELSLEQVGVPRYVALYAHVARGLTNRDGAGTAQV